jgi:hypothetical protein
MARRACDMLATTAGATLQFQEIPRDFAATPG